MIRPVRLRLSRRKGFDLQALSRSVNGLEAVRCARRGKWGNPYRVGEGYDDGYIRIPAITRESAVVLFREYWQRMLNDPGTVYIHAVEALEDIRGRNLACWCRLCDAHAAKGLPLGVTCADCDPCHAHVLLEIANR